MKTFFIDESGDLGTKGRYFVITLLAPQKSKRISNFMRKFCAKNSLQEVKASQLSFPQKQFVFNKLCSANDYTISYIAADKLNIDNKKILEDKNLCYNYLFSFLVKKTVKSTQEDITFLLDNHSTKVKSINSLADYIKIKAFTQWGFTHDLSIRYVDSKDSKVVQAADVVSNAIYAKYTYGKDHFYSKLTISESIKFPYSKFASNPPVHNPLTP
ncbi:MAG: hypothetical protein A2676_01900 [Candidatus Sungbacteria bacterium RIFCSPHIGHO2_01_FULL_51_22]|nr:MAG: hypothetical protein A2676_01900 [Candidatus Sungbacteria bacterium RIFCSPHIGHO2_01_FULL_51_22]OHA05548.1 MAG: hypothetical protein A3B29_01115 [Candidatus Sungbacteria bacterium RIFCSPLOWO2_01_FULL_51_34]